jgi:hypothetical protein
MHGINIKHITQFQMPVYIYHTHDYQLSLYVTSVL